MSSQVRILFPPPIVLQNIILNFANQFSSGSSSVGRAAAFQAAGRGFEPRLPLSAFIAVQLISRRSSGVEYFLGKEGVTGSNPVVGSETEKLNNSYL